MKLCVTPYLSDKGLPSFVEFSMAFAKKEKKFIREKDELL